MEKKLWEATISQKENSNLRSFEKFLTRKYNFRGNKNIPVKTVVDEALENSDYVEKVIVLSVALCCSKAPCT